MSMNDTYLLDAIQLRFSLKNDSQVAQFLGITRTTIHNIRNNTKTRLGIKQRLKLLDKIGFFEMDSITTKRLIEIIISTADKQVINQFKNQSFCTEDARLLAFVKDVFVFGTDEKLAKFLGIARNTVSMVRTGRTSLGSMPKLKILNKSCPFKLAKVENNILSTDVLINTVINYSDNTEVLYFE
jgi:transcriptional regulator with XRE-family HTH domain